MDRLWYALLALAACKGPKLSITSAQAPPSRGLEVTTMSEQPASCASPPTLRWSNVPAGTGGFVVVASDRELPRWAVSGIPANDNLFARRCGDYPHAGEDPCMDPAPARPPWESPWQCSAQLTFEVFALDQVIGRRGITAPELLDAIEGHVVARGTLAMTFD
jgi:phosphatidylethanolamine-binding protein (PEBP) family uncharacterized protein